MNFLIADDHAIVRKGLSLIICEEFVDANIYEASNSSETLNLIKKKSFDAILLDISMPGQNGLEILKQIRDMNIKTPILILSVYPEDQYAARVLKAGASGYLNKDTATAELITAIKKVLAGKKYISSSFAEKLAEGINIDSNKPLHDLLSDREMQVFQLLAAGKTVGEIAENIFLSVNTVSTYRTRILEKLGLNNNAEIMKYALDNNIL